MILTKLPNRRTYYMSPINNTNLRLVVVDESKSDLCQNNTVLFTSSRVDILLKLFIFNSCSEMDITILKSISFQ